MVRRHAASVCRRLRPARSVPLVLLLIIPSSIDAYACDAGQKEYFGRCIVAAPPAPKLLTFLKDYGQPVGEVANLLAPDLPLFDKPERARPKANLHMAATECRRRIRGADRRCSARLLRHVRGPDIMRDRGVQAEGTKEDVAGLRAENQPARTPVALEVQGHERAVLAGSGSFLATNKRSRTRHFGC